MLVGGIYVLLLKLCVDDLFVFVVVVGLVLDWGELLLMLC